MRGIYISDWGIKMKSAAAVLAAVAIIGQPLALSPGAQSLKPFKGSVTAQEERKVQMDPVQAPAQTADSKLSPDMQEAVDGLNRTSSNDPMMRVIIQVQTSTNLNFLAGELPATQAGQMIAAEAKENKMKAAGLRTTLSTLRGSLKRTFNNVGLVSAELPLSKVKEF